MYGQSGDQMRVSYWIAPAAKGEVYASAGTTYPPRKYCSFPMFESAGMGAVRKSLVPLDGTVVLSWQTSCKPDNMCRWTALSDMIKF